MFEDVLIMMSCNSDKVKSFTDLLKKNKISFTLKNFHDGRQMNKCVYVSYWKGNKAMILFEEFNKTYKYRY